MVATLPDQSFGSLSFFQSWEQEQTGPEALKLTFRASHLSWLFPRPGTYFVLVICLLCHDEALNCVSFRLHKTCVSVRRSGISATDGQVQRGLCRRIPVEWEEVCLRLPVLLPGKFSHCRGTCQRK